MTLAKKFQKLNFPDFDQIRCPGIREGRLFYGDIGCGLRPTRLDLQPEKQHGLDPIGPKISPLYSLSLGGPTMSISTRSGNLDFSIKIVTLAKIFKNLTSPILTKLGAQVFERVAFFMVISVVACGPPVRIYSRKNNIALTRSGQKYHHSTHYPLGAPTMSISTRSGNLDFSIKIVTLAKNFQKFNFPDFDQIRCPGIREGRLFYGDIGCGVRPTPSGFTAEKQHCLDPIGPKISPLYSLSLGGPTMSISTRSGNHDFSIKIMTVPLAKIFKN